MVMLQTRVREISNKEGFDLTVFRGRQAVNLRRNGVIGAWPHRNKTRDTYTVSDFRAKFAETYPGYVCDVLEGGGMVAHGNRSLGQVRATY